jgi:hypothetical protein
MPAQPSIMPVHHRFSEFIRDKYTIAAQAGTYFLVCGTKRTGTDDKVQVSRKSFISFMIF